MKISQVKDAIYGLYKKNLGYFLATTFALVISIILSVFLDMFLQGVFAVGVFFLIIPFLGCMIFANMQATLGKQYDLKNFYGGYRISLLPGLHGSFRFILSSIKALLVTIIAMIIALTITSFITPLYDDALVEAFKAFSAAQEITEAELILQEYMESHSGKHFIPLYSIILLISYCFGVFTLVYNVMKNVPIFYIQSGIGCSKKEAINIYKQVYVEAKKMMRKMINKICWPFYILFFVSYGIGATLGWMIFKNFSLAFILALVFSLIASSSMLTPYLLTQDILYHIYAPAYKVKAKSFFENAVINVNNHPQLNEEQKEQLKQFYLAQLQEIEQIEKTVVVTDLTIVQVVERNAQIQDDKKEE